MQTKTLSDEAPRSASMPRAMLAMLLLGAALACLPLPARGKTPTATTHAGPAAATRSAKAAPASSATPAASEEVPLPQSHVPPFAQVDTNHDGKIEWKEAKAVNVPKKVFDQFDFDRNGTLSETEWLFVRLHMTDFTPPNVTTPAPASATKKQSCPQTGTAAPTQ